MRQVGREADCKSKVWYILHENDSRESQANSQTNFVVRLIVIFDIGCFLKRFSINEKKKCKKK